jgi:NADH-quinone oxidoreductase subunit K
MLNAANLSLVGFSRTFAGDRALVGQLVPLFVIAVAAAEACVALAMVVLLARARGTVDSDAFSRMRE